MECPVPVPRKKIQKASSLSSRVRHLLKSGSMRGFTLVELAIVLIIVGLLIGVGANMIGPLTKRVKLNESRDDLNKAKEAVVSFSMSRGRLPCPDVNNDGLEDLTGAVCTACPNPPCRFPNVTLNIKGTDAWQSFLRYDAVDTLTPTTINSQNYCVVLYETINNAGIGANTILPIVTNTADPDDNQITTAGNGYTVAAVIISTGEDVTLTGKNSNNNREYEMASNPFDDVVRNDLVAEIPLGELMGKGCNSANTVLKVYIPAGRSAKIPSGSGTCLDGGAAVFAYLPLNSNVDYWNAIGCPAAPTASYTFQTLATTDWNGPGGTRRNGEVNADNTDH